MVEFGVFRLGL